jgi:hypothetical protein
LGIPELRVDRVGHHASKLYRYGIAELTHDLSPSTVKRIIFWESLQPRTLPNAEVSDGAIGSAEHVFTARDAVYPSF